MISPATGAILISDPFLNDPNFSRSVVLLCNHDADGTVGFVLNKPYHKKLGELLPDMEQCNMPVYYGGPVQTNSLHFIHNMPHKIVDSQKIADGIYWGGNFEQLLILMATQEIDEKNIQFFIGYSGWSSGQLDEELAEKSWLVAKATSSFVFQNKEGLAWKNAVLLLGKKYEEILNYPTDPKLN
jgi:putative transcriptional regulator